jgi:hypothetical protein
VIRRPLIAFVAVIVGLVGVVATKSATPPRATPESAAPPPAARAQPFAVVDDSGAIVIEARPGGFDVAGWSRAGTRVWRGVVRLPDAVVACGPCPSALVHRPDGSLYRLRGTTRSAVQLPRESPDRSTGLAGIGPSSNLFGWAARVSPRLVRLYPLPGRRIVLPLRPEQEARAVVAATRDGRAVAVAPDADPLLVGRRTLLEIDGGRVVASHLVPVRLTRPDAQTRGAACISPDGGRFAALVPDGATLRLLRGRLGGAPPDSVPLLIAAVEPFGCAFTGAGLVAYGVSPDASAFRVAWLASGVRKEIRGLSPTAIAACSATGAVVAVGSGGAVVVDRHAARPFARAVDAGCTPRGTPWLLENREVRWLSSR